MLKEIELLISNYKIEEAYDLIIKYEEKYLNNDYYWEIRGKLCKSIGEYETAIRCYDKSLEINKFNLVAIEEKIEIFIMLGEMINVEVHETIKREEECEIYNNFIRELEIYFNDLDSSSVDNIINEFSDNVYFYNGDYLKNKKEIVDIERLKGDNDKIIMIPFNHQYVKNVKRICKNGFEHCYIIFTYKNKFQKMHIDDSIIEALRNDYERKTISFSKLSASDSNITALLKYVPNKYKNKYNFNIINGWDVLSLENKIKVPLKSFMTISGFSMFLDYPMPFLTYNIEVGHGAMSFKGIGNMAKKNKKFAFTPEQYKNADKLCVSSNMDKILFAAATATPDDKFLISGLPRTDILIKERGKKNLQKLLDISLEGKKVVFNMPTFKKHDNSGIIQGDKELDGYVKIKNFNYEKFDKFLEKEDMICVMKVHHAEAKSVSKNDKQKGFKCIYFITNEDLEKLNLDLYEIIADGDMLITDYSSVYADFLFMNKPTIFVNTDIELYRSEVGIMLEPYDFWAAGPKVTTQECLEKEIKNCKDNRYYNEERKMLRPIYFENLECGASEKVWDFIDEVLNNENRED